MKKQLVHNSVVLFVIHPIYAKNLPTVAEGRF